MAAKLFDTAIAVTLVFGSALLVVALGLHRMADLVAPVILAFTVTAALLPIIKRLEQRGLSRSVAVACVFLAALAASAVLIGYFFLELQRLAGRLPAYQQMLEARLSHLAVALGRFGLDVRDLFSASHTVPANLARTALGLISRLLSGTASFALFLFMLLTMTLDFPGVSRSLNRHLGSRRALSPMRGLLGEIQSYYHLQTISNLVSAAAVLAAYLVFRIDFALLWGVLTFFLSFIPRFGMLLSFIPPLLLAFVMYGVLQATGLLMVCMVLNGLMDNVVTPRLTRQGLGLRSITVLLSSLVWLWIFGPMGALLSMPLTLFVRKLLERSDETLPLAYAISTDDYGPLEPEAEAF